MAFVARRNTEGQLVDCQVISGMGKGSVSMPDVSDEDTDSGTVQGYSSRSYISPTVRYVKSKQQEQVQLQEQQQEQEVGDEVEEEEEDDELESCYNNLDSDMESEASFCDRYEQRDVELTSDEETVMCSKSLFDGDIQEIDAIADEEMQRYTGGTEQLHPDDVDSIDGETVCSPSVGSKLKYADCVSLDSFDGPLACNSSMTIKTPPGDNESMSSVGGNSAGRQVVAPTGQAEDVISLGSIGSNSVGPIGESSDSMDNLSVHEDNQGQLTSRTYNVKMATMRRDDCSSASTCSWTDMYGGALKHAESRSNIVPSLSLNLSTTSSSGSSTYFRNLDEEKGGRHGEEAYKEWVKRKEQQKQQKRQAAKQEREKREVENATRQRLAQERYQEWCRQKELQLKKAATGSIKSSASYASYASNSSCRAGMGSGCCKPLQHPRREAPEVAKKRIEEWDRIKTQQQQRDRERVRQQKQSKEQLEKQRKQKSEGAWQNWMKSVGKRPKPVPLNQGFDSLRGTISNIYVNPIQWVSNIEPNDSRGN